MKTMKKIIACALAVMLVLALTACGAKCAHCGQRIKGDGYKSNDKVYCNQNCADRSALADKLTDIQNGNYVPEQNEDKDPDDDEIPELDDDDKIPEEGGDLEDDELPDEVIPGGDDLGGGEISEDSDLGD